MYEVIEVETQLPGYMYRPAGVENAPGLLFLHGSGGASNNFWNFPGDPPRPAGREANFARRARQFASLGFATLGLGYFDYREEKELSISVPDELVRIGIDTITERALAEFRSLNWVNSESVGIYGGSRGAEHALLLAALVPEGAPGRPDYIVSISPTALVWGGIAKEWADKITKGEEFEWEDIPSWTYSGEDLPLHENIALEKCKVPTLISTLRKDPIWQSENDMKSIIDYLKQTDISFDSCVVESRETQEQALANMELKDHQFHLVEFPFEGHCYPDSEKYPEEAQFLDALIEKFVFQQTCRHRES